MPFTAPSIARVCVLVDAPAAGAQALRQWAQEQLESQKTAEMKADGSMSPADRAARRRVTATAVRYTLEELAACAPGRWSSCSPPTSPTPSPQPTRSSLSIRSG